MELTFLTLRNNWSLSIKTLLVSIAYQQKIDASYQIKDVGEPRIECIGETRWVSIRLRRHLLLLLTMRDNTLWQMISKRDRDGNIDK